ncbi:MAG TPA: DUF4897 domain-containing protein [Kosmotogaceae bacterium]|nr:MAG: Uncharacterized protein XE05_0192 [Thermotogales bacterium 46_20]HAA85250.1 DUF4897 domain-containing protein [Kosmotogaceae bacterium]
MSFNKILILIVVVMVAITAINMYMTFSRRLKVETLAYDSTYEYQMDGTVTMTSEMELLFLKPEQINDFLEQFQRSDEEMRNDLQESVSSFAENLERMMMVEDFRSSVTRLPSNRIMVEEFAVISGFASVEDGMVSTSLGEVEIELPEGSSMRIILPEGARVLSVTPQPSEQPAENVFVWFDSGRIPFPDVRFSLDE